MTASEAREAADWHREQAMRLGMYNTHGQPHLARQYREDRAHHDRAAVALDAYADGIDAAAREREACAATLDEQAARLAKLADEYIAKGDNRGPVVAFAWSETLEGARAIRARGQP